MKEYKNSIYKIITPSGSGTGFKVADHDFVITNYHVVEGSKTVAVEDHNKDRYIAHVVMANPEVDLAFLKVDALKDRPGAIRLDPDRQVIDMQKVYINGFPFGMPFTVTEGIVSSANQPMNGKNYVQTDAAVNPGNSGGPMLDEDGYLVAVTTSKFTKADNVGFGIKHTDVIKEINDFNFNDDKFRVKCNSCGNYIEKETGFCPYCGAKINPDVFEEFEPSHFAMFTEEALKELGQNPVLCRVGRDYWEFHQGSALVRIFTFDKDYLFAVSPLNQLPKGDLNDLLTYITSNPVPPYQLAIYKNKIYISYRTHLSDIYSGRRDEIKKYLKELILKADEMDNFFKDRFGCEMSIESKKLDEDPVEIIKKSENTAQQFKEDAISKKRSDDNIVEKLKKLKELYDMALINEAEYHEKKVELLKQL